MKEDLLKRIESLSLSYTPEWRFHSEKPDIGSALAILYAEMLDDTLDKFQNTWEQHRRLFFSYLNAEALDGTKATGYLVCGLSNQDMPEDVVAAGTLLTAKCQDGKKQEYRLTEDIYVSSAAVSDFFVFDGAGYLAFDRLPKKGTVQLLFLPECENRLERQSYQFFYQTSRAWTELMIQDETKDFSHAGRILFAGNPDFEDSVFQGKKAFWIKIIPRDGCCLPAELPAVFINAGRVEAVNAGTESNMPPGAVIKLEKTVGFVTKFSNPDAWYGGSEPESKEDCMKRNGAKVRHQSRAVTPKDFERLSFEACQNLHQVKCYSGYDGTGKKSPGSVTVVALQKNYLEGRRYFYKLREQMEEFFASRMGAGAGGIYVVLPWIIWMEIHVKVQVDSYQYAMEVKSRLETALSEYLNPISGGYGNKGWEIGTIPESIQIKHLLSRQPHVLFVSQLCINACVDKEGGRQYVDLDEVSSMPFMIPSSGKHDIVIT